MDSMLLAVVPEAAIRELIVSVLGFAVLVLLATYVVGKIRARSAQQEPTSSEMLANFRELHSRGTLSDAEFRTIKTKLAARLQQEINEKGETG
jgi:hypothetical protein